MTERGPAAHVERGWPSGQVAPAPTYDHRSWIEVGLLWLSLLAYSALVAPVPGVNEPHYLAKARHYWQPDWCAGDFFLESTNAHTVFYATVGVLTCVFPLDGCAWVGRAIALGLLATGWWRLGVALRLPCWTALTAAWLFLFLQSIGNWSGEWIVGGVESKVFSYAFLFWGAGDWIARFPVRAGLWLGAAIAFHPVVGMWGALAAMTSGLVLRLTANHPPTAPIPLQTNLRAFGLMVATALPGLIPAVQLLQTPVAAQTKYAATYLQVFYRLAHHLDPMTFHRSSWIFYACLLLLWGGLALWSRPSASNNPDEANSDLARSRLWLHGVVAAAIVFALCGVAVGAGPRPPNHMPGFEWRMHLLKFYPFRLADAGLPCAVAWQWAGLLRRKFPAIGQMALPGGLIALTLWAAAGIGQAPRVTREFEADWIGVCHWIRDHVSPYAVVQTPHDRSTFKWYTERSEYVTFKDCPQDPAGIVEWNRRMRWLGKWYQEEFDDGGYSSDELRELRRETGITHLVTDRLGPMEPDPIYQQGRFRVYDLQALPVPSTTRPVQ